MTSSHHFMAFIRYLLLLCLAWPAYAGSADNDKLSRIDAYLNSYPRLQAQFIQTASDGSISEGTLYLERPGKMRWEYALPSPILIVATGGTLTYFDRELSQTSHLPINDHWLGLLAEEDVRLAALPQLQGIEAQAGMIRVSLAQEDSRLTMLFSEAPLQLRQLIATDATGQPTTITLSGIRQAEAFPPEFFTLRYRP